MRREVLPPRRAASPAGAILLSTTTMLLAIAASTLLLRDRAFPPRAMTITPAPVLEIRPTPRCYASRSMPVRPSMTSTPVVPPSQPMSGK